MKYLLLILLSIVVSGAAFAQLSVEPIILAFDQADHRRADIVVSNSGERPEYLEISARTILAPGEFPEELISSPHPEEVGLLVAPRQMILHPGERRLIRVILLDQAVETDKAWRVVISPVVGEIESDVPAAAIRIAYEALVYMRPAAPVVDLVAKRDGAVLKVTNTGNTNALLHSGQQCLSPDLCTQLVGKRIWPGMHWETELSAPTSVSFTVLDHEGERTIEF